MCKKNNSLVADSGAHYFFIGIIFMFLACSKPNSMENISNQAVVAVVNGSEITTEKLRNEMNILLRQFRVQDKDGMTPEEKFILKTNGLNRIIKNILLENEVVSNRISLAPGEYEEAIDQVKNGYPENSFYKFLQVEGISSEEWEKKFKNNMLIKKLINFRVNSKVSVSDELVKKYYEDHPEEFQKGEQVRSLHIMVESEDEARDIQKQLKSGKKDFFILAQEYSLDREGPQGGDLGYFEVGQMPEEFDGVFKLEVNKVSETIQTPYGYHIFKVVDKKPARQMNFEESKKIIYNQLLRQKQSVAFSIWLVNLKDKSDIEIKHDVLAQIN